MHDGRFASLSEVLVHYNEGVLNHPNLDPRFIDPATAEPRRLNLDQGQLAALEAFLHTLTDNQLINDEIYASPFVVSP